MIALIDEVKNKKRRPPRPRFIWGTVILTKNNFFIENVWFFGNLYEKQKYVTEANRIVFNNLKNYDKFQVSLHYGAKPAELANVRKWAMI